jgi:hypothetical protein
MGGWIAVIALYALGIGLFHLLGGLGAAGEWLEQWGERSASVRRARHRVSTES